MNASIQAAGRKGIRFNQALREAANTAIADARRAGLAPEMAMVMEHATEAAKSIARRVPKSADVTADIQLHPSPVDPDGFSVSVLVSSCGRQGRPQR